MKTVERDGIGKVDPVHYPKLYDRLYFSYYSSTPPEILLRLAEDDDAGVRVQVASNSSTPPEALTRLAEDGRWEVRSNVAANPNTSPEALTKLAEDEDRLVRSKVAQSHHTPPEALVELAKDEDDGVRKHSQQNLVFLQYRAEQDGVCAEGVKLPVEWLKQMYLTETCK